MSGTTTMLGGIALELENDKSVFVCASIGNTRSHTHTHPLTHTTVCTLAHPHTRMRGSLISISLQFHLPLTSTPLQFAGDCKAFHYSAKVNRLYEITKVCVHVCVFEYVYECACVWCACVCSYECISVRVRVVCVCVLVYACVSLRVRVYM